MPVSTPDLTIAESLNILLATQGIAPIDTPVAGNPEIDVALLTLEEVSINTQSKGWWFNQQTGGNFDPDADVTLYASTIAGWHASLPHEFIYYATIRASRVHQRRFLTSQEVETFTAQEEGLAYAILQQAHARNSNSVYSFADFPTELKGMGIDEVLFLKGDVDEKIKTLQLTQVLAESDAKKTETAVQLAPEKARYDNEDTIDTYQNYPTELRMLGLSESQFYALPAWKKTEALRDAIKLRTARATVSTETAHDLTLVNTVLSSLGEAPVTACADNALASEIWRVIYDVDRTLQNKDWFFNTEEGKELTSTAYGTFTVKDSEGIIDVDPDLTTARLRRPVTKESLHGLVAGGVCESDGEVRINIPNLGDYDLRAGDWIEIAGVEFTGYTSTENDRCNGVFQVTEITAIPELVYQASGAVSGSAGFANQPQVTDLRVVSRRLYNDDNKDWSYSGSFTGSVRYRRELYDVPEVYLELVTALTGLRLAESYPDARFETQRLGETAQTAQTALKESEARNSDFNIFNNYDSASILGRHRNSFI